MMSWRANEAERRRIFAGNHAAHGIARRPCRQQSHFIRALAEHRVRLDPPTASRGILANLLDVSRIMNASKLLDRRRLPLRQRAAVDQAAVPQMGINGCQTPGMLGMSPGDVLLKSRVSIEQGHGKSAAERT